jgi:MFS transporter, DHA2 family, multidrug resistance protein
VIDRATKRQWLGLAIIAFPCALYAMDLTVLNLAVPKLSEQLRPSAAQLLWIIDIYGFMVSGWLITMGTLGDRIGRRKLLFIGAVAFGITSLFAAFSTTASMLIAARALLGVAGATVAPSTLSLIRHMFDDERQRTGAIAIWITSYSVGGAIGPIVGGFMLEHFAWGSIFLLNVPFMLPVLLLGPSLLPEYRDPNAGRLDLVSAAMSLSAILMIIYGLKRVAENGLEWLPIAIGVAGFATGTLFLRRQRHLHDPLIDVNLFRSPRFSGMLSMYLLATFVSFGLFIFLNQYLQLVLGLSPLVAGLWTLPWSFGFTAGTLLVPRVVRRVDAAHVMSGGLVLAAIGLWMMTRVDAAHGLAIAVIAQVLFAFGVSPVVTLCTDIIIGSVPAERAGAAAAISETFGELGGVLGIAIMGSVGLIVYRLAMSSAPAAARATLGGALAVAEMLPREAAVTLVHTAREAFVRAMGVTAWIESGIVVGMAIVAAGLLRKK